MIRLGNFFFRQSFCRGLHWRQWHHVSLHHVPSTVRTSQHLHIATMLQEASCSEAIQRDKQKDLPNRMLCMKWADGEQWAVLDADLEDRRFRIIYSDPEDAANPKIWNVTTTYESLVSASESEKEGAREFAQV